MPDGVLQEENDGILPRARRDEQDVDDGGRPGARNPCWVGQGGNPGGEDTSPES